MIYLKIKTFFAFTLLAIFLAACNGEPTPGNSSSDVVDRGDPELAAASEAISADPGNGDGFFNRAQIYYKREMYDDAIADLAQAMQIDSVNVDYHHLLADIYMDYYKSRQALLTMERIAGLYPERIPTLLKLAEFQMLLKQNELSFKTLDQILQLDPQNAEAYFMMGLNFREVGDVERAINSFQTAVENDPDLKEAWVLLGDLFASTDNPIAERYYDNAIQLDSTNIDFIHSKANYLHTKGDLEGAVAMYKKVILLQPQYADAFYNIGLVRMEQEQYQEAYDQFNIAVQLAPTYFMAYYYRGLASEKQGNTSQAIADYEQSLTLKPDLERAQIALDRLVQ